MTTKNLTFYGPGVIDLDDELTVGPAPLEHGAVRLAVMERGDQYPTYAGVTLSKRSAVNAALYMLAVALGEEAASEAEKALAPHMKP